MCIGHVGTNKRCFGSVCAEIVNTFLYLAMWTNRVDTAIDGQLVPYRRHRPLAVSITYDNKTPTKRNERCNKLPIQNIRAQFIDSFHSLFMQSKTTHAFDLCKSRLLPNLNSSYSSRPNREDIWEVADFSRPIRMYAFDTHTRARCTCVLDSVTVLPIFSLEFTSECDSRWIWARCARVIMINYVVRSNC